MVLSLPRRWRWKHRHRLLAAALSCVVLVLYSFTLELPGVPRNWVQSPDPPPPPLTVLLWWEPFGKRRRMGDCQRLFNISGCRVITNRTARASAHAILFHHRDLGDASWLPRGARLPAQRWVWMNFESPSHSHWLGDVGGVFNWTMTYQADSDVFVPYGRLLPRPQGGAATVRLPRKRNLVAWVISNWNEDHERVRYYRALSRHVHVDVYGGAGRPLRAGGLLRTVSEYKFYLAFENSQHRDYITEKLWRNALQAGAVPVVLGPSRANYERFLPRNAFIHVDDFSGPEKLAAYLRFLNRHGSLYRSYFAWKKRYTPHVTRFWDEHYCTVCQALRAAGNQQRTVTDLGPWYDS
ncbi:alpha-(1,3)-fucosyltransferase 4 [Ambystoma mexicanum]|uniref:alpha-(1,3)-fucosyltransferase 4 n=1 Tax=Ambystoma mexicanum TaxID=8296 RepID=UPI0037E78AEA